jgi:preprotein translocase subunit YajC
MRTIVQRLWAVLTPMLLAAAPLFADAAKPQQKGNLFGDPMIMMMLFIVLIVWFLMIRPEQRKQKVRQKMLQNLKKGDKVMTSAGIVGIVGTIKDNTVMIKISDNNTVVEFSKSAVTAVVAGDGSGSA